MKHVILGNGPAGVTAAETIRKHCPNDTIVMIGSEAEPPYSRMAIPYVLTGGIGEPGTHLRKDKNHFASLKIENHIGNAKLIDPVAKLIHLYQGAPVSYDKLLIATGSRPAAPPIEGISSPYVSACWTLDDARNIQRLAAPGKRVLQMGAGFIGCIILEALASRGVELTVVEMGDRMVPRMMGPHAGGMIKAWCEKKGVQVKTSMRVTKLEPAKNLRAHFSDGSTGEYDLVIQATGVRPNVEFLTGTHVKFDHGVLVNEHMQSSDADVYAAGDCAEAFDAASGQTVVSAIQPNAVDQGYCAGMNMAGKNHQLKNVTQINVLDTLGLVSTSFGQWQGVKGGDTAELMDPNNFKMLQLQFDGDCMIGANSLGMTENIGVLRGLVEGKVKLGDWKDKLKANPMLITEAYLASTQAQGDWQGKSRGSSK